MPLYFNWQIHWCNWRDVQPTLGRLLPQLNVRSVLYCIHSCYGNSLQLVRNIFSMIYNNLIKKNHCSNLSPLKHLHFISSVQLWVQALTHSFYQLLCKCEVKGTTLPIDFVRKGGVRFTLRLKSGSHSWCWATSGPHDKILILSTHGFVVKCLAHFRCLLL